VCPVKIDIPELLLYLRSEITEGPEGGGQEEVTGRGHQEQEAAAGDSIKRNIGERLAFKLFAAVMIRPRFYEWNTRGARLLQHLIMRDGKIGRVGKFLSWVVPPLGAWTNARDLRPLAQSTFREQWRNRLAAKLAETPGVKP
jgi:L-lactate dehydrogenase complex protein LldF